jgi:hypothetical protein
MSTPLTFKTIRESAFQYWLSETKRIRKDETDRFDASFECTWQARFAPINELETLHYSVFCSIGSSNSNISDMLDDKRYDNFIFDESTQDILFRYYTRIYLIASEILTDFQDTLTVFRTGNINAAGRTAENNLSRIELEIQGQPDTIQNLFDFINKIFKHKTRNIHSCNHHMHLYFEDSAQPQPTSDFLDINNVKSVLASVQNNTIIALPEYIIIPPLRHILSIIVHCYKVVDITFRSDLTKFQAFCSIYEGESVRG